MQRGHRLHQRGRERVVKRVDVLGAVGRIFGRNRRQDRPGRRPRELGRHAESLTIPDVEGRSGATLRPGGITYDVGEEFEAYATELARKEDAAGVAASRRSVALAAGMGPQAEDARRLIASHTSEVERAVAAYSTAHDDHGSFVRRRPKDGRRYSVTTSSQPSVTRSGRSSRRSRPMSRSCTTLIGHSYLALRSRRSGSSIWRSMRCCPERRFWSASRRSRSHVPKPRTDLLRRERSSPEVQPWSSAT